MKTVVITGSARGFGLEMLKVFRKYDFNCVICDVNEKELKNAQKEIENIKGKGIVLSYFIDVTNKNTLIHLIENTLSIVDTIDIWINNAGVNQPDKYIWELDEDSISKLIDIDLKGTILCSNTIIPYMLKQGFGAIYNVEGHGSNDACIPKLTLYGTAKRGVTYFTDSLAKELKDKNVIVGKITPGIMLTNFIKTSLGDGEKIEISEKNKKIYNILGDYPETIANNLVPKVINNTKTNKKFVWLSNSRAFARFISSMFKKRNIFK
ncbi:MAG: SDR family NAD(P)-dependent oxidoreductase [Bacilli bacterium]|nr:SDR family NAD(P)-dependent oxidoreductase [Bacilli bacterium]